VRPTERILHRLHHAVARRFPEQRLFLRSDSGTRFIRIPPLTLAAVMGGSALVLGWTIVATAFLIMDSIGSDSARDQALRDRAAYEERLDQLARERDARAAEAVAAQERFSAALAQVSTMQSELLASEERRRELEKGIRVIQTTLRRTMDERDAARTEAVDLAARLAGDAPQADTVDTAEVLATLGFLSDALGRAAEERDALAHAASSAKEEAERIAYDTRLKQEATNRLFEQLEDAVAISMEPLDKMFSSAGMDPDRIIDQIRRSYSGVGGPLTPIGLSTKGGELLGPEAQRAARILDGFDQLNMYRMAVDKTPFAFPLRTSYRFTSGFGQRWGRLHAGVDFAGAYGSPVYATADGVVTHAGWQSGYGRLIKIKHDFGFETRFGHLAQIRVKVGDRVSRGDRIGDMGNSGRSTGPHLHYEVRTSGKPVNPMTYIKAGRNVF